jgi:fumarate reductase flavoprotein subunit
LWVDSNGKRFTNELVVYDHALWANAVYTAGGHYYFLFDDASIQKFKSHGSDIKNSFERTLTEARNLTRKIPLAITGTVAPMPDIETELADAIAKHVAWKAPTLEKLAEQIGVDPAQLVATVTGYNKAIEDGVDALFFKPKEALKYAVAKGPFYAVQARSNILGTLGGIRVNEKLEALDKNRKPIAGLYAAGYDAGGLYGDSYCVTEGLTLGFAFNSGRIAGYSARDYLGASTGKS